MDRKPGGEHASRREPAASSRQFVSSDLLIAFAAALLNGDVGSESALKLPLFGPTFRSPNQDRGNLVANYDSYFDLITSFHSQSGTGLGMFPAMAAARLCLD